MKKPTQMRPEKPFSVFLFAITIILTLTVYAVLYAFVAMFFAPSVWQAFLVTPWWKFLVVFLIAHLACAPAEFLFHRYFLHAPFPFLKRLHRQHTLHHGLTNVRLISVTDDRGKIFNRYPIIDEKQHEASFFPWYSLAAFLGAFTPIIIALQALLPLWPVAISVALAVAWSLSLYEIVHMIEHLPFETFWRPKVTHPRFGKRWTSVYCFHLRHHADIKSNESISGFFGFPLADMVFGTYTPWPRIFLHGEIVPQSEFEARPPRPRLPIRFLDRLLVKA